MGKYPAGSAEGPDSPETKREVSRKQETAPDQFIHPPIQSNQYGIVSNPERGGYTKSMGIRFLCPNGHKLNVKAFQAGRRGICPYCGAKFTIPTESILPSEKPSADVAPVANTPATPASATPSEVGSNTFEQDLEQHIQSADRDTLGTPTSAATVQEPELSIEPAEAATTTSASAQVADEGQGGTASVDPEPAPKSPSNPTETPSMVSESPHEEATADTMPSAPVEPAPASPDPLAEAPNAVWYVRPPSGGQFGPAQADMMRGWLTEGRVSPETLVWREGWADWQEAGAVFPQLKPASTAPEAPPVAMTGEGGQTASYRTGPRRRKKGPSIGLIVVLVAAFLLLLVILILAIGGYLKDDSPTQGGSRAVQATRSQDGPAVAREVISVALYTGCGD